jgi:hypothetical protein
MTMVPRGGVPAIEEIAGSLEDAPTPLFVLRDWPDFGAIPFAFAETALSRL